MFENIGKLIALMYAHSIWLSGFLAVLIAVGDGSLLVAALVLYSLAGFGFALTQREKILSENQS